MKFLNDLLSTIIRQSPSSRGRGLKFLNSDVKHTFHRSPSSRGRGLKSLHILPSEIYIAVALFTRAWIEIDTREYSPEELPVALFTRAWIEIVLPLTCYSSCNVALFTRAWIEIGMYRRIVLYLLCRPLHEGVD